MHTCTHTKYVSTLWLGMFSFLLIAVK